MRSLSKDLWFKRNLYSQHDLILKTKEEILQIDNEDLRKEVILLIDYNYADVLPTHLKGKVELYYQLYL